jgi:transposase
VHKRIAVDRALLAYYAPLLRDVERAMVKAAKQHNANALSLLQTVPGIGTILRLVLLYEMHDIQRFPSVPAFLSSCRLVKCAKASAGKRFGTSGAKIGNASLPWAFSEAAVLFLRDHPAAHKYLARLEKKQGQGQAGTVRAQKLARAVYDMRTRAVAFDPHPFFPDSWRRAGEPRASLD